MMMVLAMMMVVVVVVAQRGRLPGNSQASEWGGPRGVAAWEFTRKGRGWAREGRRGEGEERSEEGRAGR